MQEPLLTRDKFREAVFARDNRQCVICHKPGQDAHHIIERRLFPDGGYYINNGATLCAGCHVCAERTTLSANDIREAVGITVVCLPPHLYPDQTYDKWGNPILPNGLRLRGELFDDPSVNVILESVRHLFVNRVKYPRTWHLPWSPGATDDDRMLETTEPWRGKQVVITEKMDGECTTLYRDGIHARSLDYAAHPSRNRIKRMWASICSDIPENYRICGENLTAVHSIRYDSLPSFLLVFSIWDGLTCLSWDETIEWCQAGIIGATLHTVPVLYTGKYDPELCQQLCKALNTEKQEGLVVRPAERFHMKEFPRVVGKYVRESHVTTHGHWMRQRLEYNKLCG